MRYLFMMVVTLLLAGCGATSTQEQFSGTDKPKAELAIENLGYTNIILEGNAFLGCAKEDSFITSYHFSAMDGDRIVKGTACCGIVFKGCTVRF